MSTYSNLYWIVVLLTGLIWSLDFWKIGFRFELKGLKSQKSSFNFFMVIKWVLYAVGLVSFFLISYSMTLPRKPLSMLPGSVKANDIMIVLDVSRSMLADDLPPNRLEVAKSKIAEFVSLRPTDRIGIIIFSEKVFTLLPLTTDIDLVTKSIADIEIGPLGSGTNIGDSLSLAIARLESTETENKFIILLTDGVSNVDSIDPIDAAKIAKDYNIKVYTIGVGSQKDAKIPQRGVFGMQYTNTPGGSIDFETLGKISEITGAKTFNATSEKGLREVFAEIEAKEKIEIKSSNQIIFDELYLKYLITGVFLLLIVELLKKIVLREVL